MVRTNVATQRLTALNGSREADHVRTDGRAMPLETWKETPTTRQGSAEAPSFPGEVEGKTLGVMGWVLSNPRPHTPYAPCIEYLPPIWAIFGVNVGKYSMHGAYGY